MTSPVVRQSRPAARTAPPIPSVTGAAHHTATRTLEAPIDALGVRMLMADRFLLNIILE